MPKKEVFKLEQKVLRCDYADILSLLRRGENVALLTVVSREGSTPRLPGSRMLLTSSGIQLGTIGGGDIEAQATKAAGQVLKDRISRVLHFSTGPDSSLTVDMICGGSLNVLLEFMDLNDYNTELLQRINRCREHGEKVYIFTPLPDENGQMEPRFCLGEDGTVYGKAIIKDIPGLLSNCTGMHSSRVVNMAGNEYLVEPYFPEEKLYIFGAGHIARELCPLAVHLGFEVAVLDDRAEYLNRERFPSAYQLALIDSFQDGFKELNIDENSMLLIVTRGHRHDAVVLEQALCTDAFYIGMIGSRNKRDTIYRNLIDKGYDRQQLEQVRCPVGLDIGADAPEEIAISISAELIQARARKRRGKSR
ncbi:MAG: XdhC family protein [Syntrophomonas sp.]|nr:XdhC family protein [Syntrophomonas sp.]